MLQLDEPLLSPQYSSNLSPFHRRESDGIWNGLETDLERTYSGGSTEDQRRINEGIIAIEPYCSLLHLGKKNFYTTLQLVTHSVVTNCASEKCSGDSFRCTRHPLVTLT